MPHLATPPEQRKHSILVVEDEPSVRRALVRFLASRFGSATPASSVAEAKRHLEVEHYDALVVDLGLPDGSGLDLLDPTSSQRTVVISADPDPATIRAAGVSRFLQKPLRLSEVADDIRALVAGQRFARDTAK